MKKYVLMLIAILVIAAGLFGQPIREADPGTIRLGVMAGPTGFSSAGLDLPDVELQVFPSPNEVIARLANGELDMAALPTNVAANLYNKGVGIRLAAVIGNGMLSLISSKGSTDVEDLYGATLHLPGAGSTPAQMARLLVRWAGLTEGKDIFFDYSVAAPAQLAQLLIAGKVDYALLPQPFVSLVLNKSAQATLLLDVQELYAELTGSPTYPMSVLVVSETFASTYPVNLRKVLNAYKRSVDWVNGDPALAARRIEELGIMPKALAQSAIPHCNLVYVPASEAKDEVTFYFEQLHALDPASIGGRVPGSELYL